MTQADFFQGSLNGGQHFGLAQRLDQVVFGAKPEGLDGVCLLALARRDQHRHIEALRTQRDQKILSAQTGQQEARYDEIRRERDRLLNGGAGIIGSCDLVTQRLQHLARQQIQHIRIFIYD